MHNLTPHADASLRPQSLNPQDDLPLKPRRALTIAANFRGWIRP